jgi:hypothetical protein
VISETKTKIEYNNEKKFQKNPNKKITNKTRLKEENVKAKNKKVRVE